MRRGLCRTLTTPLLPCCILCTRYASGLEHTALLRCPTLDAQANSMSAHAPAVSELSRASAGEDLNPSYKRRWLVVRDQYSRVVEFTELPPLTDLRAALHGERERRLTDSWSECEIPFG